MNQKAEGQLNGMTPAPRYSPWKIGTVSFPVRGAPAYRPLHDNTDRIAGVIEKRQPALLLCAGWSVPTRRSVERIAAVTGRIETVVVLETNSFIPVYMRLHRGEVFKMGKQCFSTRDDTQDERCLRDLAAARQMRSFPFHRWNALLLNCGEIMVVRGRNRVEFCGNVSNDLREAVRTEMAMILNPTHTRMGNCGTIKAWREYLSGGKRVYVSASNWDVARGQRPSATLHSLWHNGAPARPIYTLESDHQCYREWEIPFAT